MNNTKNSINNSSKTITDNTVVPDNFENNDNRSFSLAGLLTDGAKQGVKAIKLFTLVFVLFGITNFLFAAFHLIRHLTKSEGSHYTYVTLSFVIGLIFLAVSLAFTYKYLLMDTIKFCYRYLEPFFQKVCTKVIDIIISGGNKISGKDIHKSLNVGSLMIEVYGKKLPKYVQKGLNFVLNKIPFGDFLKTMHSELSQKKDNRTLSYILYLQLDQFVSGTLLSGISMNWMYWLLPLNIIIQVVFCFL